VSVEVRRETKDGMRSGGGEKEKEEAGDRYDCSMRISPKAACPHLANVFFAERLCNYADGCHHRFHLYRQSDDKREKTESSHATRKGFFLSSSPKRIP